MISTMQGGAGNLPHELTSFVGRRREVAEVKRLLGASRMVTLTRVGGVGKTRLARLTNREIAAMLVISQRTAETHVENIVAKLGFTSRAQVAAWVAQPSNGDRNTRSGPS